MSLQIRFAFLIAALMLLALPVQSQEIPSTLLQQRVKEYKNDIRGPYHRIKWFCEDGTIRDAKDPCPDDMEGIQHATLKEEVINMGDEHHIYFGDVLASMDRDDFLDEENDFSRLKQYQLGKYLASVDDGWILRKGQFYRGAVQSEDEQAWGKDFFEWMLKDEDLLQSKYYFIRQALRDIPHSEDNNVAQRLRSESKVIAEEYEPFMDIRTKIHNAPDRKDIRLVDNFYEKHRSKISSSVDREFRKLKETLQEFHKPIDVGELQNQLNTLDADNETTKKLGSFFKSYSKDLKKDVLITELSDLLYSIRMEITSFESSSDRLKILDLSNRLEDIVLRESAEWKTDDLSDLIEKINILSCSTVGTGLIEFWEYQQLRENIDTTDKSRKLTISELKDILTSSRSVVEWSTSNVKSSYEDIINTYAQFEVMSNGFIDDRIRSSIALPLGDAVSRLGAAISDWSGVNNAVMDLAQQSSIRGLNPGYAKGKLIVVKGDSDKITVDQNNIYVFNRPPSDLKPVAGIMTVSEGNLVSHVQLLARNLGIPNAALSDGNLNSLQTYHNKEVFYAVSSAGNVVLKLAEDMNTSESNLFSKTKKEKNMVTVPVDKINLEERSVLSMRNVDANDSGTLCGPKAANLGELKSLFPKYVVEGLVIPFGIFKQHMDQPMPEQGKSYWEFLNQTFEEAKAMSSTRSNTEVEAFQLERLKVLQLAIESMELRDDFITDLKNQFKTVFGDQMGNVPVFLRSDTNMEDLEEFTGAGLNLTLFNILEDQKIIDGIKRVWASPYTDRSFKWRQQYLNNPENVFPSILIIPSVDVDYSGVMITKGINEGDEDDLTVAFSRGAGGAVDGQSAETWLIEDGHGKLLSPAREDKYMRLPASGGTKHYNTDFQHPVLNYWNMYDMRYIAQEIRKKIPNTTESDYKGAYDVELGFKDNKLWLFQIRPFVENSNAKSSEYLNSIAPKVDYDKKISLSSKI